MSLGMFILLALLFHVVHTGFSLGRIDARITRLTKRSNEHSGVLKIINGIMTNSISLDVAKEIARDHGVDMTIIEVMENPEEQETKH